MSEVTSFERPGVNELLERQWADQKFLCVGIDPVVPADISESERWMYLVRQSIQIIDATREVAAAYKPNSAFFEAEKDGFEALQYVVDTIHHDAPDAPVLFDAKRADIANTNNGYRVATERFNADGITLHPWLGGTALKSILSDPRRMGIILVRTSNPDSGEMQELELADGNQETGHKVWERLAWNLGNSPNWQHGSPLGAVMGATHAQDIARGRELLGDDVTILIPGIGTQGGDLAASVQGAQNRQGTGFLINVSSGISQPKDIITGEKLPVTHTTIAEAAVHFDQQIRNTLEQ